MLGILWLIVNQLRNDIYFCPFLWLIFRKYLKLTCRPSKTTGNVILVGVTMIFFLFFILIEVKVWIWDFVFVFLIWKSCITLSNNFLFIYRPYLYWWLWYVQSNFTPCQGVQFTWYLDWLMLIVILLYRVNAFFLKS